MYSEPDLLRATKKWRWSPYRGQNRWYKHYWDVTKWSSGIKREYLHCTIIITHCMHTSTMVTPYRLTFLSKNTLLPSESVSTHTPELNVLDTTCDQGGGGARDGTKLDVKDAISVTSSGGHDLAMPPVPNIQNVVVVQTHRRKQLKGEEVEGKEISLSKTQLRNYWLLVTCYIAVHILHYVDTGTSEEK